MSNKKILFAVGTRPNIMKLAPLYREFKKHTSFELYVMHTGQHYDFEMSKVFFEDLDLPDPDFYLGINKSSSIHQIAEIMKKTEEVAMNLRPDMTFVFGDVNSTMAISVAVKKIKIKLAHVEAGLRSFDRSMPEETNRIIVDTISDIHFVTEKSGIENLKREGHAENSIFLVGNTMIDSLVYVLKKIHPVNDTEPYILLTLHRPHNVDIKENLLNILSAIKEARGNLRVIFPAHPRTKKNIEKFGLSDFLNDFEIIPPMGYRAFVKLMKNAKLVITDSGGIQEETTYLGIPCITVRDNTERPITVEMGTNTLAGTSKDSIIRTIQKVLKYGKKGKIPPLWDGKTAMRIRKITEEIL